MSELIAISTATLNLSAKTLTTEDHGKIRLPVSLSAALSTSDEGDGQISLQKIVNEAAAAIGTVTTASASATVDATPHALTMLASVRQQHFAITMDGLSAVVFTLPAATGRQAGDTLTAAIVLDETLDISVQNAASALVARFSAAFDDAGSYTLDKVFLSFVWDAGASTWRVMGVSPVVG